MTADLTQEENTLQEEIRRNPANKSLYAKLAAVLTRMRKIIPSNVERGSLEYYIGQHPDRVDLKRRLCFVRLRDRERLTENEINEAFPEYIGAADMYAFLSELYLPIQAEGNADHLDMPTRVLHARFPDCPVCLQFRSSWLFHFGSPKEALAILDAGSALTSQYDYLMQSHVTVLRHFKQDERARQLIQDFFRSYDGDLWRTPGFRRQQAKAIKRGIPPILIVTLPKSGSVFLMNTLSRGLSIPTTYLCPLGLYNDLVIDERARDFAEGGAICVDHVEATKYDLDTLHRHGIRKIMYHYRDLRQSSLSFVHHSVSDEVQATPRNKVLASRKRVQSVQRALEGSYHQLFARWLPRLQAWADTIEKDDRFEYLLTNFDDLENEKDLISRVLEFFEVPKSAFDWSVLSSDKKERAGHFRKGLKDEWREVLSPEMQARIEKHLRKMPAIERLDAYRADQAG